MLRISCPHPYAIVTALFLLILAGFGLVTPIHATTPNQQNWVHQSGTCVPGMQGAVFGLSGDNCGGTGTSFDASTVYAHYVVQDVASVVAPCASVANGSTCYRMWYTGLGADNVRRIGYAVSGDGITWMRVAGTGGLGSVIGVGPAGNFDSSGVSYPTVVRSGGLYRMWYVGYNNSVFSIGYATSSDGRIWVRVTGPLTQGSVLRPSGVNGTFDQDLVAAPRVLIDSASPAVPCEGGRTSGTCYRMWYEGVDNAPTYVYLIGYAVSPDGMTWTRVPGTILGGAVAGRSPNGTFDSYATAVASVIKEGAFYRMWYDGRNNAGLVSIGHLVSTDGVNWVRPIPDQPVYTGSNDPFVASPDNVSAPMVVKDGLTYRMWYLPTDNRRISHAAMSPGAALDGLTVQATSGTYTLNFTTATAIPSGGSVLVTLPASISFADVGAIGVSGFSAGATLAAEASASTDAVSGGAARGALLVRLPNGSAVGPKSLSFSLANPPTASERIFVQTFDQRSVLERGAVILSVSTTSTTTPTAMPTDTSTNTPTTTNSPTGTSTNATMPTVTPTGTPTNTATPTVTPTGTSVGANRQPWSHSSGMCLPAVQGAIFAMPSTGCGGTTTTFEGQTIYSPFVLQDVVSAAVPCLGLANGSICYRMWYTGIGSDGFRRIGYATSPDGVNWIRVPGLSTGGAHFGPSGLSRFDAYQVSFPVVVHNGSTYLMWYVGYDGSVYSIGLATSTDAQTWIRVNGPLAGGAVLRPSGVSATFDRDLIAAPYVIIDQATAASPCENGRTNGVCYRMWYEGMYNGNGPVYTIGLALSPDGVNFTRVTGSAYRGAVLSSAPLGVFDENHTGVMSIVKDGPLYRMWYDAKDYFENYAIGHVTSFDGVNWVRPSPNQAVYSGGNDPGTFTPDNVWGPRVLKDGVTYRMWYPYSTSMESLRFGYATMTPGSPLNNLSGQRVGNTFTFTFNIAQSVPVNGHLLLVLPKSVALADATAGVISGFGAGATFSAEPAAVLDAAAQGVARWAFVLRLPNGVSAGAKSLSFTLANVPTGQISALSGEAPGRARLPRHCAGCARLWPLAAAR